jgi:1-acyl-sn-glycerol-3-phosphate acyltransferase
MGDDRRHYGGDHHLLSVIDRMGERVEGELDREIDQRDPALIERMLPVLELALSYFDPTVVGFERLPDEGPFLVVGNHSGGMWMPDYWAFVAHWARHRGSTAELYSLGFDFLYSIPGAGALARAMGSVPASQDNGARLLERGAAVLVYPGGDVEDYRPWSERHRIELGGHEGFVRLALRQGVPVVPMVSHGSHDAVVVLSRGDRLARRLGFDRLRINVMPIVAGPPWGVAPAQLPVLPFPAKITVHVGGPIDWSGLGPDAADDPEVVHACYSEVETTMQADLDRLVAECPHPVWTRLTHLGRRVVGG